MIRLIASDIDGTLVENSTAVLHPEMFDLIKKLKEKGILFCAASGRQYQSIANMFEPVKDDIIFLAENGAHIRYQDKDIALVEMKREHIEAIVHMIRKENTEGDYIVSTNDGSIMDTKNQEFIDLITYGYRNKFRLVEDVLSEKVPIIKVAAFRKGSIRELGERILIPLFEDKVKATMAGEEWVDYMEVSVDKGGALKTIQEYFHIGKEETIAFGDNSNDIGLLKAAGMGFAVETALEEVKAVATDICPSFDKQGVYRTINRLVFGKDADEKE
ncbi:MAG: HAD family phosphatase [Lachnospiraceae bacterium]|nr:HAD family phosphatase [Lachnospiraceae bacterium]